jgi:hypothetical protein
MSASPAKSRGSIALYLRAAEEIKLDGESSPHASAYHFTKLAERLKQYAVKLWVGSFD